MKLIFIHDGPIFYNENGQYYEYSYHGLKERYSFLADDICFLMRTLPVSTDTKGTILDDQVHVISVPNFKTPKLYITKKGEAKRIIRNALKDADIAVVRGSSCGSIALKYIKRNKIPYIYECVGCTWDSLWNHSFLGKLLAVPSFLKTRAEIRDADYVYYVTKEFLQKRYPTHGKSVDCSNVSIDLIPRDVLLNRFKRNDQLKSKKIVLGTAAALDVRYKGQQYVIRAIPQLVSSGYDVIYRLAGGNRTKSDYLRSIARKCGVSDRVEFCGSLSKDEMDGFYDGIDIYIQPSLQEGLPRSVIEAMSRGCLCLGSHIAGIPELLDQPFLFSKGCVNEIASTIKDILTKDLNAISKRNFETAQQYNLTVLQTKREQFYASFLRENGLNQNLYNE